MDETTGECAVHTDFFTNTFVNHNDGRPCVQGVCLSVSKQVFWQKVDWKATVKFHTISLSKDRMFPSVFCHTDVNDLHLALSKNIKISKDSKEMKKNM